jgi:hypothetical protein
MRKLIPLAVVAIVALMYTDSEASNRRIRTTSVPAGNGAYVQQGDGPIARLIDLERRKNAYLRSVFFGR